MGSVEYGTCPCGDVEFSLGRVVLVVYIELCGEVIREQQYKVYFEECSAVHDAIDDC